MKFRIWTILWVFALFASGMATFGAGALLAAPVIIGIWVILLSGEQFTLVENAIGLALILVANLLLLLTPSVYQQRARCNSCVNNLKELALGLRTFEESFDELPAFDSTFRNRNQKQSWRLSVLPYMESTNFFEYYDVGKPWNSEKNTEVLSLTGPIEYLLCPAHPVQTKGSHYFAVVGHQTMWPPNRVLKTNEVTDGAASTILLMEASHKEVPWLKPEDLSFDEAVELLTSLPTDEYGHEINDGFLYKPKRGINVAFADYSVGFLELPIEKETAIALLTVDGGEEIDRSDLWAMGTARLNYARIYSLSVFVLMAFLPIAKLKKKQPKSVEFAA